MRTQRKQHDGNRARRHLGFVVVCAMVPATLLGYLSWSNARKTIATEVEMGLWQSNKSVGMALFEQLLQADMELVARARLDDASGRGSSALIHRIARFDEFTPGAAGSTPSGALERELSFSESEQRHLGEGRALLRTMADGEATRLILIRSDAGRYLVGEVDLEYLWREGVLAGPGRDLELLVTTASGAVLFSSQSPVPAALIDPVQSRQGMSAFFAMDLLEERYLGAYRQVPLRFWFGADDLIVVTAERRDDLVSVPSSLRHNFLLVGFLGMWGVVLVTASRPRAALEL